MKSINKQYWRFYWPLALMGIGMVLSRQFQIGVLARYPEAARVLATIACAQSTFMVFGASMMFVPQMSNVFGRSHRGHHVCLRFTILASLSSSVLLGFLAFTLPGKLLLGLIFSVDETMLASMTRYLRWATLLIFINGLRQYHVGLLVQVKRTLLLTILNAAFIAIGIFVLIAGFRMGCDPIMTLVSSQIIASFIHLCLVVGAKLLIYRLPNKIEHEVLRYGEVLSFFIPIAMTSILMHLTRPVIYSFASHVVNGVENVAALQVAFVAMMFPGVILNVFRNFFVTFGREDPDSAKLFMRRIGMFVSFTMLFIAITPISGWYFENQLGLEGEVLTMAKQVFLVYCLMPPIVAFRNYFHGSLLAHRRTGGMAIGAFCSITMAFVASWLFYKLGWLTNIGAAFVLVLAFAAEMGALLVIFLRRTNGEVGKPEEVPDEL